MRPITTAGFISVLAMATALIPMPVLAADITVTSNSGGTGGPGCTLRDAMTAANTDASAGACSAGNGSDVIILPASATITLSGEDNATDGSNGLPSVSSVIRIAGNGSVIERDAGLICNGDDINDADEFRIFHVNSSGNLTVNDATVRNGCAEGDSQADHGGAIYSTGVFVLSGGTITASSATNDGGGLYTEGNNSILDGSVISNNVSLDADGGGIHVEPGGEMTINDSRITGNHTETVGGNGGGIYCLPNSDVAINNSVMSTNWTEGTAANGGAISCRGNLAIRHSSFLDNRTEGDSANGGALAFSGETLSISNSTFSDNRTARANANGGAVRISGDSSPSIVNTTFSGNQSGGDGGGIFLSQSGGTLEIAHGTITANDVTGQGETGGGIYVLQGTLSLSNTIVIGNSDATAASDLEFDPTNISSITGSYNIIGDVASSGGLSDGDDSNIVGAAAAAVLEAALQDNGGVTETHALPDGSLAVDFIPAGTNGCGTTVTDDQRGFVRPLNDSCDAGAVEGVATLPPAPFDPTPVPTMSTWGLSILAALMAIVGLRRRQTLISG